QCGHAATESVTGCTNAETDPKPEWRPRKEAYIAHLRNAPPSVRRVSAADKLYNARAILSDYIEIGERLWTRFSGGRDGTLWYYRALSDEFDREGRTALTRELERVV